MRRVFILVIALAMLLLSAVAALANNTWSGYHWPEEPGDPHVGSISLTLVDFLDDAYGTEYGEAVDDWDRNSNTGKGPLDFIRLNGSGDRPAACNNDATNAAGAKIDGTIHVCNGTYGTNGWLGLARIWVASNGHIDAGVALMNDSYMLDDPTYAVPNAVQHVLCQEIGHTFGLDHQGSPKKQSCMNSRWGLTNPDFIGPNQHDYDTLDEIYGSGSADDGGSSKPCNPNRKNCPANGANVHFAPRPGGGWIVTYTVPAR
jgi:hypothetical protein